MKRGQVLCVGEPLLDLVAIPAGTPLLRAGTLRMVAGGGAANVATGLAALQVRAGVMGTVGQDALGAWLLAALAARNVDTSRVGVVARRRTGLVFLSMDAHGNAEFLPAREGTADLALGPEHLPRAGLAGVAWLHFSSGPLRTAKGRKLITTLRRLAVARGIPTSVDANLRPKVWPSLQANVDAVLKAARGVDLIKCNAGEALALTGARSVAAALPRLRALAGRAAVVTLGGDGAVALGQGGVVEVRAPRVAVVDTTGAGDAAMAAITARLLRAPDWNNAVLEAALTDGCRLGSRVCTRLGATTALPRPRPGASR